MVVVEPQTFEDDYDQRKCYQKYNYSCDITGAIKWGEANSAFAQLRRLRAHTPWPPP